MTLDRLIASSAALAMLSTSGVDVLQIRPGLDQAELETACGLRFGLDHTATTTTTTGAWSWSLVALARNNSAAAFSHALVLAGVQTGPAPKRGRCLATGRPWMVALAIVWLVID